MNCPDCSQANPEGARFCLQCGRSLDVPAPPPLAAMSDERRLVTVLFADVVRSTRFAETLDPEDWKAVINGAFGPLTVPISRYEGTIAQFLGDGFLAFFGAPVAHEDDAERAVRAALEVIDAARAYSGSVKAQFGLEFAVRVGVHTGHVVVGAVGTDLRNEYLAVGDVHVAARLQAAAEPMTAVISENTRRLLPEGFELADLGMIEIRDRDEPIRTYAPTRAPVSADLGHRPAPLASVMVGRTGELGGLTEAARSTAAGLGRLVVILGEPGIGKSTLLREWRAIETERGTRWAQANVPAHATGVAYHLAAAAVRAMLSLGADADESALDAMLNAVGEPELVDRRSYVASLLSIPLSGADPTAPSSLTPQGRQARYIQVMRAVARASAREPLVLVLNDVHWSDPSSIGLLTRLLALHAQLPLLCVVVSRPEPDTAGWRLVEVAREQAGARLMEIVLDALPPDRTDEILRNLLGGSDPPAEVSDVVRRRAEGNPLFVEEIVRMLIDRRHLVHRRGQWELEADATLDIPDTIHGLLAARIDRLDADTRSALRVASVIGRQFSVPVLERLLAISS